MSNCSAGNCSTGNTCSCPTTAAIPKQIACNDCAALTWNGMGQLVDTQAKNLLLCISKSNLATSDDMLMTIKTILSHGIAYVSPSSPGRWLVLSPCAVNGPMDSVGFLGKGCSDTKNGVLVKFHAETVAKPRRFDAYRSVLVQISDWWSRQAMLNGYWLDFQFSPSNMLRVPNGPAQSAPKHSQLDAVLASLYDVASKPTEADPAKTKELLAQYRALTGKDVPRFMQ